MKLYVVISLWTQNRKQQRFLHAAGNVKKYRNKDELSFVSAIQVKDRDYPIFSPK